LAHKRKGNPQPQGDTTTDSDYIHAFRPRHDIGTCLNQYL
jgi:hypothetical protein